MIVVIVVYLLDVDFGFKDYIKNTETVPDIQSYVCRSQ
jgi:hypothetical protein